MGYIHGSPRHGRITDKIGQRPEQCDCKLVLCAVGRRLPASAVRRAESNHHQPGGVLER